MICIYIMDITQEMMEKFPSKLELSYDTIEHNKVQSYNVCMAIPEGKRCLLWFTFRDKHKVAAICYLDKLRNVSRINVVPVVFHGDLSLGTIFGGTLFHYNDSKFFAIDDIHYYKGKSKDRIDTNTKLSLLSYIMKNEIKQAVFTKYDMVVGLPIMHTNRRSLMDKFDTLPYKIESIKYMPHNRHQPQVFSPFNQVCYTNTFPNAPTAIFKVSASNQNDIYNLFCYSRGSTDHFYSVAFIPDYKTSVFMNKEFRHIKENINLDYLEESDDDEEFENTSDGKFIIEGKELKMLCYYNYRFKKWVPSKIMKTGKLCNLYEVSEMEKTNSGHSNPTQSRDSNDNSYRNRTGNRQQFKQRFRR